MQTESIAFQTAVGQLLDEASGATAERRAHKREPYMRPVSLGVETARSVQRFWCFSRDISASGIGLLHAMPIEPGEATVTVYSDTAGPVRLRAEIEWCEPCGDAWYISAARFLDATG